MRKEPRGYIPRYKTWEKPYIPIVEVGDKLVCGGITQTITEIYSQDFWGHYNPEWKNDPVGSHDWGLFLEARTDKSKYIYWKQYVDGNGNGYIIDANGNRYGK